MTRCLSAMASLFLAAATLAACSVPPKVDVKKECPPESSADHFFPPGALIPANRSADLVQRQALSRRLESAREPPLWCGEPRDGYRVLSIGGHAHEAELLSLRRTAVGWQGTIVHFASPQQSNGRNNAYYRISDPIQPPLNPSDINFAMAESGFWSGDVWQEVHGAEGAIVLIEARVNGEYRAVSRSAPSEAFLRIAQLIRDKLPPLVY
jgi:hypothetical protein